MFYKERTRVHLELKETKNMHIPISVFSVVLHYE